MPFPGIGQEDCYFCGDGADPLTAAYWWQDNVGILNLNTFGILRLEINRYDDHGGLITTQAGIIQSTGMQNMKQTGRVYRITSARAALIPLTANGTATSRPLNLRW